MIKLIIAFYTIFTILTIVVCVRYVVKNSKRAKELAKELNDMKTHEAAPSCNDISEIKKHEDIYPTCVHCNYYSCDVCCYDPENVPPEHSDDEDWMCSGACMCFVCSFGGAYYGAFIPQEKYADLYIQDSEGKYYRKGKGVNYDN